MKLYWLFQNRSRKSVETPLDLANTNLRIGICDPEFSALGSLTREFLSGCPVPFNDKSKILFKEDNLYLLIERLAVVKADVGPTLISQLIAGGLDAAFVYRSNLEADPKTLQAVNVIFDF